MTENPYIKAGIEFTAGVIGGERGQLPAPGVADRLRQYAYYMTEQQKTAGDALLVMDLWDAIKAIERPGSLLRPATSPTPLPPAGTPEHARQTRENADYHRDVLKPFA